MRVDATAAKHRTEGQERASLTTATQANPELFRVMSTNNGRARRENSFLEPTLPPRSRDADGHPDITELSGGNSAAIATAVFVQYAVALTLVHITVLE